MYGNWEVWSCMSAASFLRIKVHNLRFSFFFFCYSEVCIYSAISKTQTLFLGYMGGGVEYLSLLHNVEVPLLPSSLTGQGGNCSAHTAYSRCEN